MFGLVENYTKRDADWLAWFKSWLHGNLEICVSIQVYLAS